MLSVYQSLARLALREFTDVVVATTLVGGTQASPNKLRLLLRDGSFVDIWLSVDGDYAYHWEQRKQRGQLFRWDNAPHYSYVHTFPDHMHDGDEQTIVESHLSSSPEEALRQVLSFAQKKLDE